MRQLNNLLLPSLCVKQHQNPSSGSHSPNSWLIFLRLVVRALLVVVRWFEGFIVVFHALFASAKKKFHSYWKASDWSCWTTERENKSRFTASTNAFYSCLCIFSTFIQVPYCRNGIVFRDPISKHRAHNSSLTTKQSTGLCFVSIYEVKLCGK